MVLIKDCDRKTTREICDGLELAPRYRKILLKDRFSAEVILNRLERNLPKNDSSLHKQLAGLSIEMILYMMVLCPQPSGKTGHFALCDKIETCHHFGDRKRSHGARSKAGSRVPGYHAGSLGRKAQWLAPDTER